MMKQDNPNKIGLHPIFHNVLLFVGLGLYLLILFAFLFLKTSSFRSVNFIPFRSITAYLFHGGAFSMGNVLGNILLFVPLGIYLPLLSRGKRIGVHVLWIVLISIAVELLQYLFQVGASDIDDVLLNGLGGLLGILLYQVLRRIFKEKVRVAVEWMALIAGITFLVLMICVSSGVFGFRIRILDF